MKTYLSMLVLCVISTMAVSAQAASLLAPGEHDQVPAKLAAPTQAKALAQTLDRTPVGVSHALDSAKSLDVAPKPFIAQSREFWSEVGESELRAGVKFTTTAPGALIRLSPQGGAGAALDPAGVLIRGNGRNLRADEGNASVADTKALRAAGMDVPAGTLAFRLAPSAGSGKMEIAAVHAQGRYLVHVFEPESALVLNLTADRDTVLVGSRVTFHATLTEGGAAHGLDLTSGIVTAPDGYSANLQFTRSADGFNATFTPDAAHSVGPQLWEAHVFTSTSSGQLSVLRDANTAFAVSAPTARFNGDVQVINGTTGTHVALGIDAGTASRYQVSGVLYGTGADGTLHPSALAQSAAWVAVGSSKIDLDFDADALATGGLHAPFELRDLRLTDQANMAVIERRERAMVLGN